MTQIVAVLPHKDAARLGPGWKAGGSNAYTRTMVRFCASEEEAWTIARRLSCIWTIERAGA